METKMKNRIGSTPCCGTQNWLSVVNRSLAIMAMLVCAMSVFTGVANGQQDRTLSQNDSRLLVDDAVAGVCPCDADVNGDGVINSLDLAAVGNCTIGDCSGCTFTNCDVNCDGTVDQADVDAADCMFINPDPAACCPPVQQKCAPVGQDCFTTLCDGHTTYDFSGTNQIPADYFGPGSDPFEGQVAFGGPGAFPGDTIVRRDQQMCFPDPLPVTQTIPIQIIQLNLVSCSPITVTFNGNTSPPPQQWDLFVRLDQNNLVPGDMTVTKTHANGGTYSANLPVNAEFAASLSGFGLPTTTWMAVAQVVLSTVCDGVWGQLSSGCSPGFAPGMNDTNPSSPCCQETCHESNIPGHLHCTVPPDCTPCLPAIEDCIDGVDNDGDGLCDCDDPDCDNDPACLPPYENWVIADDFKLKCAKCQCDFNGDGVCTAADVAFAQSCFGGSGTGCERVDYDCNGHIEIADITVLNCLMAGNPAADCCPDQDLTIDRTRWYGSYFDTDFEPPTDGTLPLRSPDSWFVAIHRDIPATSCPAPPAGFTPIDLCGTLDICPDGTGSWVFTPNGSANSYSLVDGGGALAAYAAGDEVRICGHVDTSLNPCIGSNATIVVNAAMPCHTKVSRPGELVAQWVIDDASVLTEPYGKIGCDGHRIFRYTTNLNTACLEHDNSLPGEIDTAGVFHPFPNRVYWVSYQAVVGRTVDAACSIIKTGEVAIKDFWGWHTTPPGHQHMDDAYVGMLHMGCPEEWVYNWVYHLHCSDPLYKDCCQDPTKSIDMAFQLFRGDLMVWNQPVNPGPPNTPFPPLYPIPGGGIDEYAETLAIIQINLPDNPGLEVQLNGPMVVQRGDPTPTEGTTGNRTVQTEMLSMDLTGASPLGPVRVRAGRAFDLPPSLGEIVIPADPTFQIDSFFDVWVDIEIVSLSLRSATPIRVQSPLWEIPPSENSYTGPVGGQAVDLIDGTGLVVGKIKFVQHWLPYNGGVNIHSDVNWTTIPSEVCCEPNATGSACVGSCPDATYTCLPTESQCNPNNPGTCTITKCDCLPPPPDDCHMEGSGTAVDPYYCDGGCPLPPWPIGTTCDLFTFVNADGTVDYDCRCEPEVMGACCDLANNVCFYTFETDCPAPSIFHANADCDPMGTCCLDTDGDGLMDQCNDMSEVCCNDIPGSKFHPNNACDPQGLCCYDSDNNGTLDRCDNLAETCCKDNAGIFHAGLDCAAELPAECCTDTDGDGFIDSCEFINQTCCDDMIGSSWIGGGDCSQQTACCYDSDGDGINDSCETISKECCHFLPNGTFTGLTCTDDPQPCCVNGVCVMIDRACCETQGGVVGPAGTVCTGPQACCDPASGSCSQLDPICCELSGGISSTFAACQGDGACCNPITGTCTDVDQLCCSLTGGSPQGVGTACSGTPEACCMPDGTCQMMDPLCCQDVGGHPQGPGTTCTTFVACCLPDGTCGMLDPLCCVDQGGSPQDPAAVCSGFLEACCLPDGTCDMLERLCCEDQGGTSMPGAICSTVLEACCLPDGTCDMLDPLCCEARGGTPQGPGSDCTDPGICSSAVCEPNPTGLACNDVVCPIAGEKCLPTAVQCDAAGCIVLGCDCQPDTCNITIDAGTFLPDCVSGCPTADNVCTLHGIDSSGDGVDDLFRCECAPLPPLPDPATPGALACGGGSAYGLPCMTCSGGTRDGLLCLSDSDCTGVSSGCLPNDALCPGASCGGAIAGPGTTYSWPKNRYIGFEANPAWAGMMIGIRVTLVSVAGHPTCSGVQRWAGHPASFCEGGICATMFNASASQAAPHYMDWTTVGGPVQIYGEEFIPGSVYKIQAVEMGSFAQSLALNINSAKWGDVDIPMFPFTVATQPQISDVLKIVDKWLGFLNPVKARSNLQPQFVNPATNVGIADVLKCVDAWLGTPYPYPVSTAVCP